MTTIIIDNSKIEENYSEYEIKMKFIEFLESEMWKNSIDLYEIYELNLSKKTQNRLSNIEKLNFIEY